MQVDRLRLAGFKSFVEPTELAIEPGLTGIVGPNGCGKSNLVEALRWVMGEASARKLRGGEMDDVIFAGSGNRPARNLAEVALAIDNSARDAPFAHNDAVSIEVARRIVRGGGSSYRINGRETRARDVQLLFADAASGAHSAALVGQGRVGALIGAKPTERRMLVDEAAGTAGLLCPPPRGRTETAGGRRQSGAARRCRRDADSPDRDPEEAGAAGAALPPARRPDSPHRGHCCSMRAGRLPRRKPKGSPANCASSRTRSRRRYRIRAGT